MRLENKDKRDLISVAKRALTYSGIVVLMLALLMGVYYMGIRYERNRIKHPDNTSMHQDKSKTK